MSANGSIRRTVVVANPNGFHMRPATLFVKAARTFRSEVAVCLGDQRADGRSLWALIGLAALPGAELVLEVDGDDAAEAVAQLLEILASPGDGF